MIPHDSISPLYLINNGMRRIVRIELSQQCDAIDQFPNAVIENRLDKREYGLRGTKVPRTRENGVSRAQLMKVPLVICVDFRVCHPCDWLALHVSFQRFAYSIPSAREPTLASIA
jgi:hypothetical protein